MTLDRRVPRGVGAVDKEMCTPNPRLTAKIAEIVGSQVEDSHPLLPGDGAAWVQGQLERIGSRAGRSGAGTSRASRSSAGTDPYEVARAA